MRTSHRRRGLGAGLLIAAIAAAISTAMPSAGAVGTIMRATLHDATGAEVGTVSFIGRGSEVSRVEVVVDAASVANLGDFHGTHIHTVGVCDPNPSGTSNVPFGSAEGHWNPTAATHGSHSGDLPSVLIQADGRARARFETDRFDVSALLDGDGSAVILHAGRDNFANIPTVYSSDGVPGPNAATLATGDSSTRYACGVVTGV